jgi:hypothetical protein
VGKLSNHVAAPDSQYFQFLEVQVIKMARQDFGAMNLGKKVISSVLLS